MARRGAAGKWVLAGTGVLLVGIALVAMILRELSPQHLLAGTILFGWNPIVSNFGTGKTDTVMVFFLLLGATSSQPCRWPSPAS